MSQVTQHPIVLTAISTTSVTPGLEPTSGFAWTIPTPTTASSTASNQSRSTIVRIAAKSALSAPRSTSAAFRHPQPQQPQRPHQVCKSSRRLHPRNLPTKCCRLTFRMPRRLSLVHPVAATSGPLTQRLQCGIPLRHRLLYIVPCLVDNSKHRGDIHQ